jgi:transposase
MSSTPTPPSASTPASAKRGGTPVGVDVGERELAAVAAADVPPEAALVIDGGPVRESYGHLVATIRALQAPPGDAPGETAAFAAYYHRIRGQLHDAAARVVQYARDRPAPVLVLEDLAYPQRPLWEFRDGDHFGTWLLPAFQAVLRERAVDARLPVVGIEPQETTLACHRCGELGEADARGDRRLRCSEPDCPVDAVDRDRSAAVTIARRGRAVLE